MVRGSFVIVLMAYVSLCLGPVIGSEVGSIVALRQVLHGNKCAEARFAKFKDQMEAFNLPYLHIAATPKDGKGYYWALNEDYLRMFDLLLNTTYQHGIICEDDAYFHPNLLTELNLTMAAAEGTGGYNAIALCSGHLRNKWPWYDGPAYHSPMSYNATDSTGRVFLGWPYHVAPLPHWGSFVYLPGAPVCLLVRNNRDFITALKAWFQRDMKLPADVIVRDFVGTYPGMRLANSPQLCVEQELGAKIYHCS